MMDPLILQGEYKLKDLTETWLLLISIYLSLLMLITIIYRTDVLFFAVQSVTSEVIPPSTLIR